MSETTETPAPGRPAELQDGKRVNVYLDAQALEIARRLGDGNVSAGIRRALRECRAPDESA